MTYEVRPIEASDGELLRRMFARLSTETVYQRFFRPKRSPSVLRHRPPVGCQGAIGLAGWSTAAGPPAPAVKRAL